jgi:hypothetical protein
MELSVSPHGKFHRLFTLVCRQSFSITKKQFLLWIWFWELSMSEITESSLYPGYNELNLLYNNMLYWIVTIFGLSTISSKHDVLKILDRVISEIQCRTYKLKRLLLQVCMILSWTLMNCNLNLAYVNLKPPYRPFFIMMTTENGW